MRPSGVFPSIAVRIPSSSVTISRAEVAIVPTAMALTRTRGDRSAAAMRVQWVSAPFAVP